MSQHIGDIENLETYNFLRDAVTHLLQLTKVSVERVAYDLHPRFLTSRLAHELGEELKSPVVPLQHHNSHILSLMAEKGLEETVGIACDGAGFGSDGSTWGVEILHCTLGTYKRIGHLQEHHLLGGDLAAIYPLRMALSILGDSTAVTEWLIQKPEQFPHGTSEIELILNQLKASRSPLTTSCGRVLDAVSALLGLCTHRTYEGEPALKLESAADAGVDVLKLTPQIHANVLDTSILLSRIFESRGLLRIPDLAYSAEEYLAKGLACMAIEAAQHLGIRDICFSGGVAYNNHMTTTIKTELEAQQIHLIVHELVPPGDGGISLGQALAAGSA
jgi:hydrogenase maturation protein HypF